MVPQLLTEEQVADSLQVPAETVRYWRQARKGPKFTRLGKHVRYTPDAVQEFIASNTQGSARARRKGR